MPKRPKRVLITSDWHCGHLVGLTPPDWQEPGLRPHSAKFAAIERECWDFFSREVKALQPIDVHLCLGDVIDGSGTRSGGTELITTDRNQQVEIAAEVMDLIHAPVNVVCKGTPYHTGVVEELEDVLALQMKSRDRPWCKTFKIGNHEWVEVNGVTFDLKHKVGGSQIPHGRYTASARDVLWNVLWHESGYQPRADILLRGHVHYAVGGYRYVGARRKQFGTMPALQAMGTRYGGKECSGLVDYGFYYFDIDENGGITWGERMLFVKSQKAKALVV